MSNKKKVDITIRNRIVKMYRDINLYYHSNRSGNLISSNISFKLGIKQEKEKGYLHISVINGSGHLKNYCVLDLPSFVDFRFSLRGEITLIHSSGRAILKIPPGPPMWQLKMTRPPHSFAKQPSDRITIGDEQQGYQ